MEHIHILKRDITNTVHQPSEKETRNNDRGSLDTVVPSYAETNENGNYMTKDDTNMNENGN